jgi:pilus assembly protein Flp/PilA
MKSLLSRFVPDEKAATAIEYGLIAALISAAVIAGGLSVGNAVNGTMDGAAQHLKNSQ